MLRILALLLLLLVLVLLLVAGAGAAAGVAFGLAPTPTISTSIEIAAPPSRVWAVLMDTAAYPAWNPSMRLIGTLAPGAVIENIEGQGEDQMVFWPTVLKVQPNQELRWLGHYKMPGIFDANHYFLLTPSNTGTRLTQGETFRGIALWFYDVQQLAPNFRTLNQALKSRSEAP